MEQSEFVVVTDDSVGEFDTSFGWKICTLNGESIVEHAGPAFGQAFIPKIQHIQGHQDKHKKYDELSLSAKLNVDADLLVVEYRALTRKWQGKY
eukprot:8126487-Ditylum_brightwellii.AAC.1